MKNFLINTFAALIAVVLAPFAVVAVIVSAVVSGVKRERVTATGSAPWA